MLRRAFEHESEMIRRWRNHPRVREASFTTHEIGEAEHAKWWAGAMADATRRILVYEHEGVPSGVVNFFDHDAEARRAGWAFYLDVDGLGARGELFAAWLTVEGEAIGYAFGELGVETLRCEVLAHNAAVRTLHRRNGFVEVGSYTRPVDGTEEFVLVMELVRPGAPA
ncbi:UDP-4-amino-4,6-dideoxy-N-acetyl-beta-L-altrosamine N-acetyltransferase [Planomonospora sp. ID82291]|uniref:UDP-4-amino-4, 6-dideoxy-N-acetyl-beta-L-altrosamine N-acetyltransferase n=1 Tax=Planomonospora sp. ID82291 TaxID=2738136 RepID=UPI0018C3A15A|nr:UDP-4-amino-4,6-dideoxy-N-acetyl-beta-L-altrosamine N-acetyltransferase [Planomonospora sp. ID82291]MBG0813542.1 UDP-4-amino-4,6-dideoxy-N-acetyl-beta-L-altrosamine N-acetyltransferase [Planomonospora sp. ID82291]